MNTIGFTIKGESVLYITDKYMQKSIIGRDVSLELLFCSTCFRLLISLPSSPVVFQCNKTCKVVFRVSKEVKVGKFWPLNVQHNSYAFCYKIYLSCLQLIAIGWVQ